MAESDLHKGLVSRAAKAMRAALCEHGRYRCFVDGPAGTGGLPPLIDGYRPDVYALTERIVVVGGS